MKVCPNCGSENLKKSKGDILGFLGGTSKHFCKECGYEGRIFLEIDPERLKEAKETLQDKDTPDLDTRETFDKVRFVVGIVFLILGIPPLVYAPLGGSFLVGAVSAIIGLLLFHREIKKLDIWA